MSFISTCHETEKWGRGDSNPHAFRHMILSHARLPIPTLPHEARLATGGATEEINQRHIRSFLKAQKTRHTQNNTFLFYQRCLAKAIERDLTSVIIYWFLSTLSCKNGKFAYYRGWQSVV